MKAFKLTPDGDIDVTYGRASLVQGGEQTAQQLRQRFEIVRGEWAYNRRKGIPLFDEILGKGPLVLATHAVVVDTTRTTPGISAVEQITLDMEPDRRLSIVVKAKAGDTPVDISTVLGR